MKTNGLMCESLMIGDWVMHRGEPIMVYEIDDYYERINTEPDGYNAITCVEISEVTPIPLTPEILEKNFESLDMEGEYFGFYDEYFEVEVSEFSDGIWEVKIDEIVLGATWRMYVSNVHELQRALRFCSINKEITL